LSENGAKNDFKSKRLVRGGAGGKVMRENKPVLPVLSVYEREIILEKGEILSEKRHLNLLTAINRKAQRPLFTVMRLMTVITLMDSASTISP
jgi:hypothetical protein